MPSLNARLYSNERFEKQKEERKSEREKRTEKTEENRKEKKGKGEKRFKEGGRRTDLRTSLERTDQTEHGVIFRTIAIATGYRSTLPGRF